MRDGEDDRGATASHGPKGLSSCTQCQGIFPAAKLTAHDGKLLCADCNRKFGPLDADGRSVAQDAAPAQPSYGARMVASSVTGDPVAVSRQFGGRYEPRPTSLTGATGGLGATLCRAFAASGASLVLHGRVVRKLEALYDELVAAGAPEPAILPLDLEQATSQSLAEAAAAIERQLGRLDAIVHCAATLKRLAPIEHHPIEEWMTVMRVNLGAPAALTRACMPLLRRAPSARVIFTLDSRGHDPKAYWGSYAAAKAGLEALVHVLADEWESTPSLSAIGVIPGPVDSPMRKRTHPGGETGLRSLDSLVPLYATLVGTEGAEFRGRVIDAQAWAAPGS